MKNTNIGKGPKGEVIFYENYRGARSFLGVFLILGALVFLLIPIIFGIEKSISQGLIIPTIIGAIVFFIIGIWHLRHGVEKKPLLTITDKGIKFSWKKEGLAWTQLSSVFYEPDLTGRKKYDCIVFKTKGTKAYRILHWVLNSDQKWLLRKILKEHGFSFYMDIKPKNIEIDSKGKLIFKVNDNFSSLYTIAVMVIFFGIGARLLIARGEIDVFGKIMLVVLFCGAIFAWWVNDKVKMLLTISNADSNDFDKISWQQISAITFAQNNANFLTITTQDNKEYRLDISALKDNKKELLMKVLREHGLK